MTRTDAIDRFDDGDAYERYVGRWSRPVSHLFLEWLDSQAGLTWADVGCGTGALTEAILSEKQPRKVTGVEPSSNFLRVARGRIKDKRVEFLEGNALSLPLNDRSADIVVSGLVLNFLPDIGAGIAEMVRVLRPRGTLAAYVWDYAGEMQMMRYFWNAVAELFPNAAELDEGNLYPICNPMALQNLLMSRGLAEVETCSLETSTVFENFDDYWMPFQGGQGPAGAYCAALSPVDQRRLGAALKSRLPFTADGSIEMIARAWAVRGRT